MTTLTIRKSGRCEFDRAINIKQISLSWITLYMKVYNLSESTTYKKDARTEAVTIPAGYYTYEELQEKMSGDFKFDKNTLKIIITGTVSGGLKKLIEQDSPYLNPLCFYMYIDGIDTSKNWLDGKRSSLLSAIPIGNGVAPNEIFTYVPVNNSFKTMSENIYNSINIVILDEYKKPYTGKFVAELKLI